MKYIDISKKRAMKARLRLKTNKLNSNSRYVFAAIGVLALVVQLVVPLSAKAVVTDPSISLKIFGLSTDYSVVSNQPTASGSYQNGSVQDYPEGSCIPMLMEVSLKQNQAGPDDILVSPVYDYLSDELGINDLEKITTSVNPVTGTDNLSDFSYSNSPLSSATSFKTSDGITIQAQVTGPFAGNDQSNTAVSDADTFRHYNVLLEDVPEDKTVEAIFCLRLGLDSSENPGASLSARNAGGQQNRGIQTNQILILPSIILTKVVSGGSASANEWSFIVNPQVNEQSSYSIATDGDNLDTVVIENVNPDGDYTITESGPDGYTLSDISGTNCVQSDSSAVASVAAGKPATEAECTFTNTFDEPTTGELTVTKIVVNNSGTGSSQVADFDLFVDTTQVTSGATNEFDAGDYLVTESGPDGYTMTFNGNCDEFGNVTVPAGGSASCTITNDDIAPTEGTVTITKVVTNDNGGTATTSDFVLKVGDTAVTSGVANQFEEGDYVVSEMGVSGYAGTFSGNCDSVGNLTVEAGESYSCTITNNDTQPILTVTKLVVNDDQGNLDVIDFPLFVGNVSVTSGQANGFNAGDYVVTETGDNGYTLAVTGDCAGNGRITLEIGEVYTCTLTNDDIPATHGSLTVTKIVTNDNGGQAVVSDFDLFVDDTQVTSGDANQFVAGDYAVSEDTEVQGYTGVIGGDCNSEGSITIVAGQSYECTITNNDQPASLTVTKVVVNDDQAQDATTSDFILSVGDTEVTSAESNEFDAGDYEITEDGPDGYLASFDGDCDETGNITLAPGGQYTCTITNNDIAPDQFVLTLTKSGDGTGSIDNDHEENPWCDTECEGNERAYASGTTVTLTPNPSEGSTFDGSWSGGCTGTGLCIVTMVANILVNAHFGLVQSPPPPPSGGGGGGGGGGGSVSGSISGVVYNDSNSNGTKDGGESALSGWTVYLDANNNDILDGGEATKISDANGFYQFSGLSAGTYAVRQVTQSNWTQTDPNAVDDFEYVVGLGTGSSVTAKDFGNIGGQVLGATTGPTPPQPQVAGAATELPRTGAGSGSLLLYLALLVIPFLPMRKKLQANPEK